MSKQNVVDDYYSNMNSSDSDWKNDQSNQWIKWKIKVKIKILILTKQMNLTQQLKKFKKEKLKYTTKKEFPKSPFVKVDDKKSKETKEAPKVFLKKMRCKWKEKFYQTK